MHEVLLAYSHHGGGLGDLLGRAVAWASVGVLVRHLPVIAVVVALGLAMIWLAFRRPAPVSRLERLFLVVGLVVMPVAYLIGYVVVSLSRGWVWP